MCIGLHFNSLICGLFQNIVADDPVRLIEQSGVVIGIGSSRCLIHCGVEQSGKLLKILQIRKSAGKKCLEIPGITHIGIDPVVGIYCLIVDFDTFFVLLHALFIDFYLFGKIIFPLLDKCGHISLLYGLKGTVHCLLQGGKNIVGGIKNCVCRKTLQRQQ